MSANPNPSTAAETEAPSRPTTAESVVESVQKVVSEKETRQTHELRGGRFSEDELKRFGSSEDAALDDLAMRWRIGNELHAANPSMPLQDMLAEIERRAREAPVHEVNSLLSRLKINTEGWSNERWGTFNENVAALRKSGKSPADALTIANQRSTLAEQKVHPNRSREDVIRAAMHKAAIKYHKSR